MSMTARLMAVLAGIAAGAALIAYYIVSNLVVTPPVVAAAGAAPRARLTLQTVATLGFKPHADWVSYLVQNPQGKWVHSTYFRVPAHSTISVTVYQFDTATGLRNPFFGQPRGLIGEMTVNGKRLRALDPSLASHTFAVPELGVTVPLEGVASNAKNQCSAAPCSLSEAHQTVRFTFRTGAPGEYRWQCFVPCAAGFIYGNGGPMQSIGYMDGVLQVV